MKLLVDNQLPEALATYLSANGIASRHVRQFGLGAVSDAEIWNFARAEGFHIVTMDEDFQHLAARCLGAARQRPQASLVSSVFGGTPGTPRRT